MKHILKALAVVKTVYFLQRLVAVHGVMILAYAVICLLIYVGRTKGHDIIQLSSDAAAYAGLAASRIAPERFHDDLLLGHPQATTFAILALHYYLVWTHGVFGTFGNALALLLPVAAFVQLLGFHFLARQFGLSHLASMVCALLTLLLVNIGLGGEYWGIESDPTPRQLYQALLPVLMGSAIRWRHSYLARILLMAVCGALVYLHSHSALTQAFAIWMGLIAMKPAGVEWQMHILRMVLAGLLFVLMALPYAIFFVDGTRGSGYPDPVLLQNVSIDTLGEFNSLHLELARYAVVAAPFLGMICFGWRWARESCHGHSAAFLFVGGWFAGVFLISVFVPAIDYAQAWLFGRLPFEYDFVRSLRYVIPMGWLFLVIVLAHRPWEFRRAYLRGVSVQAIMFGFALLTLGLPHLHLPQVLVKGAACGILGDCGLSSSERDMSEIIKRARALPAGTLFFTEETIDGLTVRQSAYQPVVYTEKDGGWFIYARDYDGLREWSRRRRMFMALRDNDNHSSSELNALFRLACAMKARYVVIREHGYPIESSSEEIVYKGREVALFRLSQTSGCSQAAVLHRSRTASALNQGSARF